MYDIDVKQLMVKLGVGAGITIALFCALAGFWALVGWV